MDRVYHPTKEKWYQYGDRETAAEVAAQVISDTGVQLALNGDGDYTLLADPSPPTG